MFLRGDNLVFLCRHHHHGSSIAGGLVKGALSVAASAYKALFAGPPITAQVSACFIFLNQIQVITENYGICLGWRVAWHCRKKIEFWSLVNT